MNLELSGYGKYPKSSRLRHRKEFDRIHQRGVRIHRELFTVVCVRSLEGPTHGARFGCAVSRKVGNSVVRSRLKRLLRELFRRSRSGLPSVDLVTILRPGAAVFASSGLEELGAVLLPAWGEASSRAMKAKDAPRRRRCRPRTS
ncbi:MAG: ribonuclease P protein component [Myxococcales bacterium]|nr:ribonuclease P protein component [Myxococcales bacterium]